MTCTCSYPAKKTNVSFEKHMDILFMITHDANFNAAVQALTLIHQVATTKQVIDDLRMKLNGRSFLIDTIEHYTSPCWIDD